MVLKMRRIILIFWLFILYSSNTYSQIQSLSLFLSQEFQSTIFSSTLQRNNFFRSNSNISLNVNGFIYHPNIAKFKTEFFLFKEKNRGIPLYPSMKLFRYSPYNVQLDLFSGLPISLSIGAFQCINKNDTPFSSLSGLEKRWSIFNRINFPNLPKITFGYTNSFFSFDGLNSINDFRLKQYFANLNYELGRFSTNFTGNYDDYSSMWFDSLKIHGKLKYLSARFNTTSNFSTYKFEDLSVYSLNWNWLSENHRFYLNGTFNRIPKYDLLNLSARYENWERKALSFLLESGIQSQKTPSFSMTEEYLQASLVCTFEKRSWNFAIAPKLRAIWIKELNKVNSGIGGGMEIFLRKNLKKGIFRSQIGFDHGKRLILPTLYYNRFSGSFTLSKNWQNFRLDLFNSHFFQKVKYSDFYSRYYQNNLSILLNFLNLKSKFEVKINDLYFDKIIYKTRSGEISAGDIDIRVARLDLLGRFEFVNGSYYLTAGTRFTKYLGEFQFFLTTSYYKNLKNGLKGEWLDTRFIIKRPVRII
jgi:hypothetical protein